MLFFRKNREDQVFARQVVLWIPNMLTAASACLGLYSIRFALDGRVEQAAILILVAAICDGLDGFAARSLKATSPIGAQLDSLADFLSFGVAPAMVVYWWSLDQIAGAGWAVALSFVICCGYRLARFNVTLQDPGQAAWAKRFFTGIPAPAAAACALLLPALSFASGWEWTQHSGLNAAMLLAIAIMMASRVATFSTKSGIAHLGREAYPLLFAGLLLVGFGLVHSPWWTISAGVLIYLLSIPISVVQAKRLRRSHACGADT